MRRRGRRRNTSTRHCSGGVRAVGALIESAPVLIFRGLEKALRAGAKRVLPACLLATKVTGFGPV